MNMYVVLVHDLTACWVIFHDFSWSSADFKINFKKSFWNNIRKSNGLDPIWVQPVCKGYQQTTKVLASKERVNHQKPQLNLQQAGFLNCAAALSDQILDDSQDSIRFKPTSSRKSALVAILFSGVEPFTQYM